jgi:hypothetical protein
LGPQRPCELIEFHLFRPGYEGLSNGDDGREFGLAEETALLAAALELAVGAELVRVAGLARPSAVIMDAHPLVAFGADACKGGTAVEHDGIEFVHDGGDIFYRCHVSIKKKKDAPNATHPMFPVCLGCP